MTLFGLSPTSKRMGSLPRWRLLVGEPSSFPQVMFHSAVVLMIDNGDGQGSRVSGFSNISTLTVNKIGLAITATIEAGVVVTGITHDTAS